MRARRGSSQKGTVRRPSKKLKCEKKSPAKVDVRESAANPGLLPKGASKRPSSGRKWPDLEMMLQSDAKGIPKTGNGRAREPSDRCLEPSALGTGHSLPETDSPAVLQTHFRDVEEEEEEEDLKEEESQGAGWSDESEMEPEEVEDTAVEVDNSAFLNEDSNQPLPVDRFFGSVAFMQDLPAPPLTRAIASRREFRKAHFIAKEEEEEEEEEDGEEEDEEEVV